MINILTSQSSVPANDRGFLYGDGCFTTMAIGQGKVELMTCHFQRLAKGCQVLDIEFCDFEALQATVIELAKTRGSGFIKVVITRGQGGRGYSPSGVSRPNCYVSFGDFPSLYDAFKDKGMRLNVSDVCLGHQPMLAGIKHLNRLEQVKIKGELDKSSFDDALVCDLNGHVVETSMGNVFWRIGQQWETPIIDFAGVEGVMRNYIMDVMENNKTPVVEIKRTVSELDGCDEMIVTNSLLKVMQVTSLTTNKSEKIMFERSASTFSKWFYSMQKDVSSR